MGKILQKPSVPKKGTQEDKFYNNSNNQPKKSCPLCKIQFNNYNTEIEVCLDIKTDRSSC